jgi:hypothetical protein
MRALGGLVLCLSILSAAFGCQSKEPQLSEREKMNRSQLYQYPPSVQDSFLREYPDATVTSVNSYTDSSGRKLYAVKYVRSGQTGNAVYTPQGERAMTADTR